MQLWYNICVEVDEIWQLSYIDTISILFSIFHFSFFLSPFPASPCGGYNSRAFYAELSGDMRISALKIRVLCSDPSRQEGEEAREVKYRGA